MDFKKNENKTKKREVGIRDIAYSIYFKNRRKNVETTSVENWLRAESIYDNKARYYWRIIKRYKSRILLWTGLISFILCILPYVLEVRYRPTLTIIFNCKKILQAENGDWLADYNLTIGSSRHLLILPKDVFVSYGDYAIIPNGRPDSPGGEYSNMPAIDAKSMMAWRWSLDNSIIKANYNHRSSIGLFARARLKEKRNTLPAQIVIYAGIFQRV